MFSIKALLLETVKFVEKCQTAMLMGKIDFERYYWLTKVKYSFINSIVHSEDKKGFIDRSMEGRLYKIYINKCFISFMVSVLGNS